MRVLGTNRKAKLSILTPNDVKIRKIRSKLGSAAITPFKEFDVSNSEEVPSQLYHRLVEQLRSSDVRYHELVNQLPEVVLELDLKGRLTFLNAAWFDELGYPVEESTGRSIYQFVPQEHHPPIAQILSGASPSRVAGDAATPTLEVPFLHQTGNRIWYQFT